MHPLNIFEANMGDRVTAEGTNALKPPPQKKKKKSPLIFQSYPVLNALVELSLKCYFWQSRVTPGAGGPCEGVNCRAGRECVLSSQHSTPTCVCVKECPDHWKPVSSSFKPLKVSQCSCQVCGSDGVSYDNHCYLHKAACDTGARISPRHAGFCR